MKCRDPEYSVGLMGPHVCSCTSLPQKTRALLRANGRNPPMAQPAVLQPSLVNSQQVRAYRRLPRAQVLWELLLDASSSVVTIQLLPRGWSTGHRSMLAFGCGEKQSEAKKEHGCVSLPRSIASSHLCKGGRSAVCSPPWHKVKGGAAVRDTHSTILQSALHTIMTKAPTSGPCCSPANQTTR